MSNEKYPLPILSGMDIANQPKTLPEELAKIFLESTTGISTVSNNLIDIIISLQINIQHMRRSRTFGTHPS